MDNQQPSINTQKFYQKPKRGYGYIYKYTSPTGKSYIGQTINSPKDRAKNSFNGIGYKKCPIFWKAIQKYGWRNFSFEILEEIEVGELNKKEIYYINFFNTIAPNGYNSSSGGEGGKTREVFIYSSQNGQFLEHFGSLSEASRETGVPIETISSILSKTSKKHRMTCHNLIFSSEYVPVFNLREVDRENYQPVFVYDLSGNFISSYNCIASAARALGVGASSISRCLRGEEEYIQNYQFKKEKTDNVLAITPNKKALISVFQIDPKTKEIIAVFPSMRSAALAVGLSNSNGIKRVISRGKGTSGGFFWSVNDGSTTIVPKNPGQREASSSLEEDIVSTYMKV